MVKLILLSILLLLSLLVIFRAPLNLLWYVSILVTEFSWIFLSLVVVLVLWPSKNSTVQLAAALLGLVSFVLLSLPYIQAWQLGQKIGKDFFRVFPSTSKEARQAPFSPLKIFGGINAPQIPFRVFTYDTAKNLRLDFYPAQVPGPRPCILVIHGGSWAGGDSRQLPELNSELALAGYHVASINYRLAPKHHYPSPVEDVLSAIRYLQRQAAELRINASQFVLLGRSAGGQVALSAAYTLHEPAIKGVINFYGPTDMVWGYENPTNPLVLDSRKIMEDYLGGTLQQVRDQYLHSSATETVNSKTPPTLLIYGENDPLVSPRHGTRLQVKLKAMNVPHYELYLPWATHGFDFTLNGPGGQLSTWTVKAFLKAVLQS